MMGWGLTKIYPIIMRTICHVSKSRIPILHYVSGSRLPYIIQFSLILQPLLADISGFQYPIIRNQERVLLGIQSVTQIQYICYGSRYFDADSIDQVKSHFIF